MFQLKQNVIHEKLIYALCSLKENVPKFFSEFELFNFYFLQIQNIFGGFKVG